MQYRKDVRSGNELSVLGFGCMRFPSSVPGAIDEKATEKLILQALDQGINYFDTAYIYPNSEHVLGSIIERNAIREKMLIATKLPHQSCKKREDFDRYLSTQLERLKTDHIDYYLIHNVTSLAEWKRLLSLGIEVWISEQKRCGAIRQIDFSFHGSQAEFAPLLEAYDWDFVQIQYNYMNENYQAGKSGLLLVAEKGLPVIIMEPLLGGKLATGLPKGAKEVLQRADSSLSPAEWALRWLWDQPEVTVVLSGMNTADQIEQNAALASRVTPGSMNKEDQQAINHVIEVFNKSYKVPCTGCNYCLPCPKGINIPAAFVAYNASYVFGWYQGVKAHTLSAGSTSDKPHYLADCVDCGACAKKCPQHIAIPEELKKARRRVEPKFLAPIMSAARKSMSKW